MPEASNDHLPEAQLKLLIRLAEATERAYGSMWRLAGRAFLQGIMSVLGAAFGSAVILGALVWVFNSLGGLNWLQPHLNQLGDVVSEAVIPDELRSQLDTLDSQNQASQQDLNQLLQQLQQSQ